MREITTARRHAGDQQMFAWGCLMAASVIVWRHSIQSTFTLAWGSDSQTHLLLIVPVATALIFLERRAFSTGVKGNRAAGAVLLLLALMAEGIAKWGLSSAGDLRLSLSMAGLVVWWIGSVIACFGTRIFRAFLFPLCFLFLITPIPSIAVDPMVEFLQEGSATVARVMFQGAGVPVTQDGTMLSLPGLDIEVAPQCSSIRSSLMLVIVTLVVAHLLLRAWWRKALLVACAIPLSLIKNGLRIFVISELGTRVDAGYLNGRLHHQGGIVFFAISVAMLAALVWILRRGETSRARAMSVSASQG